MHALVRLKPGCRAGGKPDLDGFTSGVRAGFGGNPAFPTPKVSLAELASAQLALPNALTAQPEGNHELPRCSPRTSW